MAGRLFPDTFGTYTDREKAYFRRISRLAADVERQMQSIAAIQADAELLIPHAQRKLDGLLALIDGRPDRRVLREFIAANDKILTCCLETQRAALRAERE